MRRTPIIAGNWKMNTTVAEAVTLVQAMKDRLESWSSVERVLCPPFISLSPLHDLLKDSPLALGAQDVYWEDKGAYTGEVSPLMLKDLARYVIIGHSERRQYFGETDATVNKKVAAALKHGLVPIICVGENLAQNEAGQTAEVVVGQVRADLAGFRGDEVRRMVIAYEPIWAIGTGRAATAEGANGVIALIRNTVRGLHDDAVAEVMRIQYGGSVTAANAAELIGQPEIDGALVGGASLKPDDFVAIVEAAARYKGTGT